MKRALATFLVALIMVGAGATTASAEPYFEPGTFVLVSYNDELVRGQVTGEDTGDDSLVSVALLGIGKTVVDLSYVFPLPPPSGQ